MLRDRMLRLAKASHLPRRTVRLRLTLLYGGLFLLSGAALLAITYFFVDTATGNAFIVSGKNGTTIAGFEIGAPPKGVGTLKHQSASVPVTGQVQRSASGQVTTAAGNAGTTGGSANSRGSATSGSGGNTDLTAKQMDEQSRQFMALAHAYQSRELRQLLVESGIALAIMAVVAVLLGWIMAGRVLRPLRTITATTRDISASSLHQRLALAGPDDELKELGDTIDGLLGRLEASFDSQRQFVANASHELRTPLTRQRTLAQVALSDPHATAESLRAAHERVLVSGEQQEQLIDALLTLSRAQSSTVTLHAVDLTALVRELVEPREIEAEVRGVRLASTLAPAQLEGNRRLVERLVVNLLDNALRYNTPGGVVRVECGTRDGAAWLAVTNDGPVVRPDEIGQLYEPFVRLGVERTAAGDGFGLGLCVVRAVATAHGATLETVARPGGGLAVEVRFLPTDEVGGGEPGEGRSRGWEEAEAPPGSRPEDLADLARSVGRDH